MEDNIKQVKDKLLKTINRFYKEYKHLPPMIVTENEIDDFLNVVADHFKANQKMDEYDHAINILIRRALYFATIENKDGFIINNLVQAMDDLTAFHIPSAEIKAMQEELFQKSFNNTVMKKR